MTLLNNLLASLPFMNAERADYLIDSFWPMLEAGLLYTIPLAIVSFIYGVLIALGVAIIRTIPDGGRLIRFLQLLCRIYISIIRGTPMLVQIFIIFYGLPEVGITLEPFPTAIIAFSRLYLGVHYPGDVLAGFLVALLTSTVACRLMRRTFSPQKS